MSPTLWMLLTIYILIFGLSAMKIKQLVEESVDELNGLVRLENIAELCDSAGIDRGFLRGGLAIALESFKMGFSKQMLANQIWLCFIVVASSLISSETFDSEFKLDFKLSALSAYIDALTEENKVVHVDLTPMIKGLSILREEVKNRG